MIPEEKEAAIALGNMSPTDAALAGMSLRARAAH